MRRHHARRGDPQRGSVGNRVRGFSGEDRQPWPTFFFVLALVYLVVLLLLAVGREAGIWFLDELHDPIAGVLPLGVPWFGALGAVTLSLYGVFDHNDHWNPKWNYWHIAQPLVGIILAYRSEEDIGRSVTLARHRPASPSIRRLSSPGTCRPGLSRRPP